MFLGELIDARYPDYSVIIPKSHEIVVVMDREELLKAVRTSMIFAKENADIVRVDIGKDRVSLRAISNENGESLIELPAQVNGSDLSISFNGRFLIEHLSHISTPQIVIKLSLSTRPATIRPADLAAGEEYLHVIMPMHPPR
jgi:DNA polymerase-3 subunit beta